MSSRHQPQMRAAILAAIEAGHQRTEEISAHTGITTKGVCTRLCYMRDLGLVNSVRTTDKGRNGNTNIWRLGPATEFFDEQAESGKAEKRVVVISKTYPTLGLRDPLVAALFGAPAHTSMVPA